MKLLIVDDNAPVRQMIRHCLADIALNISELDNGANAVAVYAAFLPDWVLMDIQMKQDNGIAATARIKAAFPEANIVIVTNHNNDHLRQAAAAAGACGYILKENLLDLRRLLTQGALEV